MSPNIINQQLHFLKDCYALDHTTFAIHNFFDDKYDFKYLIESPTEELLNQAYPKTFIPDEIGIPIEETLLLNAEDKELLYCSLFICGSKTSAFDKKTSKIISPLIYANANIKKIDNDYFLYLESKPQINIGFLKTLDFTTTFENCRLELYNCIKHGVIDFKTIGEVKSILDKHISNLNTQEVMMYPDFISYEEKQYCFKPSYLKKLDSFKLISCSGILISSKANNIASVDFELNRIIESNQYSGALKTYFNQSSPNNNSTNKPYEPIVPMILNQSQEKVLQNAQAYSGSVIIGPPGTGKSYTITALAMDLIRQGKTVLIATKTDRALNVIEEKLLGFDLKERIIKIGGLRYNQKIKRFLRLLTSGFHPKIDQNKFKKIQKEFHALIKALKKLESDYISLTNKSIQYSDSYLESSDLTNIWLNFYHNYINRSIGSEITIIQDFYMTIQNYLVKAEQYFKISLDKQLEDNFKLNRSMFVQFKEALNHIDNSYKFNELNNLDFDVILKAIPLWLTKIKSVSEYIPLKPDMFDVVIFDEATQCDMASCIPVLQRGKQVVIAGDTNQLRHYSFISNSQIKNKLEEYNLQSYHHLNYRNHSMLDLILHSVQNQDQIVALYEHYRSLPSIIEFSNTHFYNSKLDVMTSFPNHIQSNTIYNIKVNGERSEKGINNIEIEEIVKIISSILEQEGKLDMYSSIGVLSPFTKQVEAITRVIKKTFTIDHIKQHQILVGTPYSFQGSEKDIMILSLAIDNQYHHGSLQYLNKEDVFNVAITRAKKTQIVIHSFDINKLPEDTLTRAYLEKINTPPKSKHHNIEDNPTYKEIIAYMKAQTWNVYMNHHLAGMTVDILFEHNNHYYAIDLIGFPGDEKEAFTIERYKVLNRVGIKVFPLSFLTWNFDKNKVITQLNTLINQYNIPAIYHSKPILIN